MILVAMHLLEAPLCSTSYDCSTLPRRMASTPPASLQYTALKFRSRRLHRLPGYMARSKAVPVSSSAAAADTEVAERTLQGEEAQHWSSALDTVQTLGFDQAEAETILRKAYGWSGQGYWRKSKEYEVPAPGQVDAVADFLRGLGFADKDVQTAVKVFPQILGLSVEEQLQGNVAKLKKDWKMTDKVIPGVIKRQPQVLGYNVDCEGNCLGECNRCWVRF